MVTRTDADAAGRGTGPATVQPGDRSGAVAWLRRNWTGLTLALAVILWTLGLRHIAPTEMSGAGLIPELSPAVLVSYPLALTAAIGELRREHRRGWLLSLATAALVVMMYGLQPAVEGVARLSVGWLHAGFSQYIADTGETLSQYDVRFSFPGFFAGVAFLCRAAGIDNPEPLLNWAPVFLGGAAVLAMRALGVALFGNGRAGWVAAWIFLLGNWTEQEYFSPQGTAMVLLIAALAVTVRYLVAPSLTDRGRVSVRLRERPAGSARNRIWAHVLVVLIAAGLAPTHQLTPYVLVGMLFILLVWGRLWSAWLPALALAPILAWFVFGARDFWVSQLSLITDSFGRVDSSVSQGIGARVAGDFAHRLIVLGRVGITVAVGLLAVVGFVILWRRGRRSLLLLVLAASSFALAVAQPYGGEVFVRCYLFGLPWLAASGAVVVDALLEKRAADPARSRHSGPADGATEPDGPATTAAAGAGPRRGVLVVAVSTVLLSVLALSTVAARGGNDAYVSTTESDVAAMNYVLVHAAPKDTVIAPLWFFPLRLSRVGDLRQGGMPRQDPSCAAAETMATCIAVAKANYVVVNPQQDQAAQILDGYPSGWMQQAVTGLQQDYGYSVAFSENGVQVLVPPKVPTP